MTPGTSNKGCAEPVATLFLKIRGTFWGVTIIRLIVYQGLHGVPRIWKTTKVGCWPLYFFLGSIPWWMSVVLDGQRS